MLGRWKFHAEKNVLRRRTENKTRRLGERVTQKSKRKKMRGRNVAACIISVVNEKNGTKGGEEKKERRKIKEKNCGREGLRKGMREIL